MDLTMNNEALKIWIQHDSTMQSIGFNHGTIGF